MRDRLDPDQRLRLLEIAVSCALRGGASGTVVELAEKWERWCLSVAELPDEDIGVRIGPTPACPKCGAVYTTGSGVRGQQMHWTCGSFDCGHKWETQDV